MFTVTEKNQIIGWVNEKDAPPGKKFGTKSEAKIYRDSHRKAPPKIRTHKYNPFDDGEPDWATGAY